MLSFQIVHPISYNFYLLSAVSIVSPGSSNPPGNPNLPSNLESEYPLFFSPCTLPEMHIYKGKVWMLIPEFFFCPAKVGSMFHNASNIMFLLHLAKNIAWAARLYFSSPGGSKCFSTSTQSSSIALKAWPELQRVEDNLTDLRRGKHLCILQNKVCNWICFFFSSFWLVQQYWNNGTIFLLLCRWMFLCLMQITFTKSYQSFHQVRVQQSHLKHKDIPLFWDCCQYCE